MLRAGEGGVQAFNVIMTLMSKINRLQASPKGIIVCRYQASTCNDSLTHRLEQWRTDEFFKLKGGARKTVRLISIHALRRRMYSGNEFWTLQEVHKRRSYYNFSSQIFWLEQLMFSGNLLTTFSFMLQTITK